uniref:Uncharacterized protein n=1 Tax=Arundo donax TaxID=35708 RepID=A0A0A9AAA6_ARUDO
MFKSGRPDPPSKTDASSTCSSKTTTPSASSCTPCGRFKSRPSSASSSTTCGRFKSRPSSPGGRFRLRFMVGVELCGFWENGSSNV